MGNGEIVENILELNPDVIEGLNNDNNKNGDDSKKKRLVGSSSSVFLLDGYNNKENVGNQQEEEEEEEEADLTAFSSMRSLGEEPEDSMEEEYGLLITLGEDDGDDDSSNNGSSSSSYCQLTFVQCENFTEIHPNVYGPAVLSDLRLLGGGGSGVTIFAGKHPALGDLVMKHGADKDLKELFALATIAEELDIRDSGGTESMRRSEYCNATPHESSEFIKEKIPEFRFIYISPYQLNDERKTLYTAIKEGGKLYNDHNNNSNDNPTEEEKMPSFINIENRNENLSERSSSKTEQLTSYYGAHICIYDTSNSSGQEDGRDDSPCSLEMQGDSLCFMCHHGCTVTRGQAAVVDDSKKGNEKTTTEESSLLELQQHSPLSIRIKGQSGYTVLKSIFNDLLPLMKEHRWKFTLGQKTIGGQNPMTGNQYLYSGQLKGPVLDNLLSRYIRLILHMENLATPEERDNDGSMLERIRAEIHKYQTEALPDYQISDEADLFVGHAIKKNIDPIKGRFVRLNQLGKQFRSYFAEQQQEQQTTNNNIDNDSNHNDNKDHHQLFLTPEELIPARNIGKILRSGSLMADVFQNSHETVVDDTEHIWRALLRLAVQERRDGTPCALKRLWTCGLTDAGLHNLFVSGDNLWLFDLGEPRLYSVPAFLTKFLFSFFHTLGMQEDETGTTWVNRFQVDDDSNNNNINNNNMDDDDGDLINTHYLYRSEKLQITKETKELLEHAYDAFEITLDRIIDGLFHGDDGLRWLLIRYVTLQLFSDASFCLHKWLIKGGGRDDDENHNTGNEKWLWRALWDFYAAYDLQSADSFYRLKVEHPAHREDYYDGLSTEREMPMRKSEFRQSEFQHDLHTRFESLGGLMEIPSESKEESDQEQQEPEPEKQKEEEKQIMAQEQNLEQELPKRVDLLARSRSGMGFSLRKSNVAAFIGVGLEDEEKHEA